MLHKLLYFRVKECVAYVTWPTFNFGTPSISKERLKIETSNFVRGLTDRRPIQKVAKLGQLGTSPGSHDLLLNFGTPSIFKERYPISTWPLNPRSSYYYFWLPKNKRPPYLNSTPGFDELNPSPSSSFCYSALAYQILCKSDDRQRSYNIILILQDGGHGVANLLPVTDLATSDV